jgi:glutathione synthase/RimK-type ligase-like ATP-grasp enzyme
MNLPIVNTFVTNEKHEAMDYIKKCKFPAVAKITCGAGSQGVRLVKNYKQAKGICNKVFEDGLPTYWRYIKQKNYIYFQDFVPNAKFDLRIIIAGNSFFGYYRQIPKDDFRASGAGKEDFATPIPEEALLLAKKVKDNFPKTKMLAVDMLKDERNGLLYIIECSIFLHVDFPSELTVNGRQGRYIYENGQFVFEEGKYWCQELSLLEAMKEWINQNNCCNEKVDEYVIQPNR